MAAPQRLTSPPPTGPQLVAWLVWFVVAGVVLESPAARRAIGDVLVVATLVVSFAALLVFGDVMADNGLDDDWSGR